MLNLSLALYNLEILFSLLNNFFHTLKDFFQFVNCASRYRLSRPIITILHSCLAYVKTVELLKFLGLLI